MAEIVIRPDRLYPVIMQQEVCVNEDAVKQTEEKMAEKRTEEKTGTISLIDGKQNYKRKPQKQTSNSCSASRLWVFFSVLFFLTTVAAVAAFIWRHSFYDESRKAPVYECVNGTQNNTKIIFQRYGGFFRNRTEQSIFAKQFYQNEQKHVVYANQTLRPYYSSGCTFTCKPQPPSRKKRQVQLANTHFHACCISETSFISPDELPGIDDIPRTLAHFDDLDKRQYFQTQSCQQVLGCNGCRCTQAIDTHTALIEANKSDDDKFVVEMGRFKIYSGG
ncbi:hypothetical protein LOTGIDRAFT_236978 [Lottia gigantea]|uniref:Uncharacterized protein n=1 Tax=Lottia gigantea TaxID=225164 RepID=V3ZNQ1_LOTGI|nr:hypothetical protein LOTGIDRAFT_236978 [Lottia gigantea]ESO82491.1 hypothetical protein LOTGIDRAFT_236978 [Lottia gigantea]